MIFKRIKKVRESLGFLRQEDFAKSIDVKLRTYQSYEQGQVKTVPHTFIVKLYLKYNVCIVWLLTGTGDMFIGQNSTIYYINNRDGNVAVNGGTININKIIDNKEKIRLFD